MPYHRCAACGLTTYSAATYSSADACPACLAVLTDDTRLYLTPGVNDDVSCTLPSRPEAAAEARRALVGLAFSESTRENIALLVSELVTNAVRHAGIPAGDPIQVELHNEAGRVRLAVHDGGGGFPLPVPEPEAPLVADGRGLLLVDALSDAWGVEAGADGCTVWCEVPVDPALAA
jgi:anti-sigma regulatory factor (Ser/Thr protein kinase)